MNILRTLADARTLFVVLVAGAVSLLGVACEADYDEEAEEVGWEDEEVFDDWDADDDDALSEEEFSDNVDWFESYDENDDGVLTEAEYQTGFAEDFGKASDFDTYDTDGNGEITEEEFNTGLFEDLDQDDDDLIGEDEWGV